MFDFNFQDDNLTSNYSIQTTDVETNSQPPVNKIEFCKACGSRLDNDGTCPECKHRKKRNVKIRSSYSLHDTLEIVKGVKVHGKNWYKVIQYAHDKHLLQFLEEKDKTDQNKVESHFNSLKKKKHKIWKKNVKKFSPSSDDIKNLSKLPEEERMVELQVLETNYTIEISASNLLKDEIQKELAIIEAKEERLTTRKDFTTDELKTSAWKDVDEREAIRNASKSLALQRTLNETTLNSIGVKILQQTHQFQSLIFMKRNAQFNLLDRIESSHFHTGDDINNNISGISMQINLLRKQLIEQSVHEIKLDLEESVSNNDGKSNIERLEEL